MTSVNAASDRRFRPGWLIAATVAVLVLISAFVAAVFWADDQMRGKDEDLALKLEEITIAAELPVVMALGVIVLCWLVELLRWLVWHRRSPS